MNTRLIKMAIILGICLISILSNYVQTEPDDKSANILFIMNLIPSSFNFSQRERILFSERLYTAFLTHEMRKTINLKETTTATSTSANTTTMMSIIQTKTSHLLTGLRIFMRFWETTKFEIFIQIRLILGCVGSHKHIYMA